MSERATSGNATVIVVGGGLAGHAAALSVAELGGKAILIEKTDAPGGSSSRNGGSFAVAGTDEQRERGIEDSSGKLRDDLIRAGAGSAVEALVDVYVSHQIATFNWLKSKGVLVKHVSLSSGQGVPRSHTVDPKQMMRVLHEAVQYDPRITYIPQTAARQLAVDRQGRVIGVKAAGPDGDDLLSGPVVLATGGFVRSRELLQRYAPALQRVVPLGGLANTGDGLVMATELGAGLRDMAFVRGTYGIVLDRFPDTMPDPDAAADGESMRIMTMYRGGIIVNKLGQRFTDESKTYKLLGDACLKQPDGVGFQVFDQRVMSQSNPAARRTDFSAAAASGLVRSAESIAGVAEAMGIDPQALVATVDEYNADVRNGLDRRFGRRHLGGTFGTPPPIDTPPFHIIACTTGLIGTYCELAIDPNMRVLAEVGKPIAGLFAAGEVVGGLHGGSYMSGSALAKAAIFGRLAGRNALERTYKSAQAEITARG